MATAGRAITFSGITVAIGLSAMLFYQGIFLASMGAAGAIVVGAAVFYGLTFLPALLAVLGPRVNLLTLPVLGRRTVPGRGPWYRIATSVMRRPVLFLIPALGLLLALGSPFLHLRLAQGGVDQLPARVEARQGYDDLLKSFPGFNQTNFDVVVHYANGSPLTPERIGQQYDLSRRIAAVPGVLRVESIYAVSPSLSRSDYQRLYADPSRLPASQQQALSGQVGKDVVLMTAVSNQASSSDGARNILKAVRAAHVGGGGQVLVTGETAYDVDVINFIISRTPVAVGFVILVTYFVLFLLTGSLVLPLKAVLVNLLSIAASFGALVWIFQDGHLSSQLAFTPQYSIDPTTPVILFAIVFGMSMDYEVLLVSRIHEEYVRTGDNRRAVAEGLQRSGRLITGAAAIMVGVFLAFGLAEVVIIKAIGIGLAVAVAIDATIVRVLIVPAVMRLLGDYNWWAPRPLRALYERARLGEFGTWR
jgi:RND superfamily putative drug exporter